MIFKEPNPANTNPESLEALSKKLSLAQEDLKNLEGQKRMHLELADFAEKQRNKITGGKQVDLSEISPDEVDKLMTEIREAGAQKGYAKDQQDLIDKKKKEIEEIQEKIDLLSKNS